MVLTVTRYVAISQDLCAILFYSKLCFYSHGALYIHVSQNDLYVAVDIFTTTSRHYCSYKFVLGRCSNVLCDNNYLSLLHLLAHFHFENHLTACTCSYKRLAFQVLCMYVFERMASTKWILLAVTINLFFAECDAVHYDISVTCSPEVASSAVYPCYSLQHFCDNQELLSGNGSVKLLFMSGVHQVNSCTISASNLNCIQGMSRRRWK